MKTSLGTPRNGMFEKAGLTRQHVKQAINILEEDYYFMRKEDAKKEVHEMIGKVVPKGFEEWLDEIGYFDCPAAKSHHGAERGGLVKHSIAVAKELVNLTDKLGLEWERAESPLLIGLLHDICKCYNYKWEYNENGEISNIDYDDRVEGGHGSKSALLLASHIQLTHEELMCIRYHILLNHILLSAFTDKSEWKYYSSSIHDYPNILYTHTADMIASQVRGI